MHDQSNPPKINEFSTLETLLTYKKKGNEDVSIGIRTHATVGIDGMANQLFPHSIMLLKNNKHILKIKHCFDINTMETTLITGKPTIV